MSREAQVVERRLAAPAIAALIRGDLVLEPEPHGGGDLVVAAAAGVELGAGGTARGQLRLDVHVDVLEVGAPLELAAIDLRADFLQPVDDDLQFARLEHPDLRQHLRVRDAAGDVVPVKLPVERDRFGVIAQAFGRAGGEASAPKRF